MKKLCLIGVLLIVASAAQASISPAPMRPAPTDPVTAVREKLQQAFDDAKSNDFDNAEVAFDKAIHAKAFAALPESLRYQSLMVAGLVAKENKKNEVAHGLLVQASTYDAADATIWSNRLVTAYATGDNHDAAHCTAILASRWPKAMSEIRNAAIYVLQRDLVEANDNAADFEMLNALFDASWTDEDGRPDFLWQDLTRLLLEKGNVTKATTVAQHIRSANVALSMRVDKRFDVITQRNPEAFDVDRLAAAEITAAEARVKTTQGRLGPLLHLQRLLMLTQKYKQALAVTDGAVAAAAAGEGSKRYKDFDEKYVWLLNDRSRVLGRLGQWDEAARQMAKAARRPEGGAMNVSQAINLGGLYANLHQPDKALDAISEIGNMSDFGRMQLESVKLRIAIDQKDTAGIDTHMVYLRKHHDVAIGTWQNALLLHGDFDEAAKLLIERLRDPKWRNDAIVGMQKYADVQESPGVKDLNERWDMIVARPEVQAALLKVGRIEHFHVTSD
ncbi:MAG: hypothetical protein ABI227_12510 [Rhodanobacter sp.]